MFIPFPKLARLSRGCVITEKLDGTNAAVIVYESVGDIHTTLKVAAQSRTRLITPGKTTDNYGFAAWVAENEAELLKLGVGHHYGEWYGRGIQRGYGLDEKRFALFGAHYWPPERPRPACVSVVPVLFEGAFCTDAVTHAMGVLRATGSQAVPGYMDPEGVVVWHEASRALFKKTYDDNHKEAA